ncbi:hypothetical protein AAHO55_08360 [Listeria aquatica]
MSAEEGETLDALYELAKERKEEAPEMGTIEKLTPEEVKKRFPLARNDYGAVSLSGGEEVKGRLFGMLCLKGPVFTGHK